MEVSILPFLDMNFRFDLFNYSLAPLKLLKDKLDDNIYKELLNLQDKNNTFLKDFKNINKGNLVILIGDEGCSKLFIDSFFYHMHKGGHDKLLCSPNRFSIEDFKYVTYEVPDYNPGALIERQKFKFNIHNQISDKIFYPSGYENLTLNMVSQGYDFLLNEKYFHQFKSFFLACKNDIKLQRSIHFYNKSIDNSLNDDERILFSCCAIEVILDVAEEKQKRETIKLRLEDLLKEINFKFIDSVEVSKRLKNVIDVLYDFRSGYVHSGNAITRKLISEWDFIEESQLAMFSLSLTSFLISKNFIEINKFEGLLCNYLFSKDILIETIDYFRKSVDDIDEKAKRNMYDANVFEIMLRFLHLCDMQTLMWDENIKSKWLRAMDYIIGWLYPLLKPVLNDISTTSSIRHERIHECDSKIESILNTLSPSNEEAVMIYSIYKKLFQYNQRKFALY